MYFFSCTAITLRNGLIHFCKVKTQVTSRFLTAMPQVASFSRWGVLRFSFSHYKAHMNPPPWMVKLHGKLPWCYKACHYKFYGNKATTH